MTKPVKAITPVMSSVPKDETPSNVSHITPVSQGGNGGPTLEEEVKEWGLRAQAVEDDFHPLAVKVLKRVMETQNATIALQLQNAMPRILRKREFAAWLATYSPINLRDEDAKTSNFKTCRLRKKDGDEFSDKKLYREWDIEKAMANPFFMKKEEVKALDPSKLDMVKTLVQSMTSTAKSILGVEKAKPLASGVSIDEAKASLKGMQSMHTVLENASMAPALAGTAKQLVKDALNFEPAEEQAA